MKHRFLFTFLLVSSAISFPIKIQSTSPTAESYKSSERNTESVLKYLRPVLRSIGQSARLYYEADCEGNVGDPVPFPVVKVQAPAEGQTGLSAIQKIFNADERVTVKEEPGGMISIRVGQVSAKILQAKLTSIDLEPMERYNATEAIGAIENAKDFQEAAHSLRMVSVWSYSAFVTEPREGLPHLPETIQNMTVDQALDLIAQTFKGILVYGECARSNGERLFWIDFVRISGE